MANSGKRQVQKPDGEVRRSQMVGTYGPGATIDLVHQAVLVGGLDVWHYDKNRKGFAVIQEPRLRESIAEQFRRAGLELSIDAPFREPPAGDDREPSKLCGVQVLEFPQWFVCQNPSCRALIRKDGLDLKQERYWHMCPTAKRPSATVPVRFLGACKHGHIQEFPWIAFAHLRYPRCAAPSLSFEEGATGDFSEIEVRCVCGAHEPLSRAIVASQFDCRGERPWLGVEGREECDQKLRLLVRTASNSYFHQVVSALSIPEPGRELEAALKTIWSFVEEADAETLPLFRKTQKPVREALKNHSDDAVLAVLNIMRGGKVGPRAALRTAEFQQFVRAEQEKVGELPPSDAAFHARTVNLEGGLPDGVSRLVVAKKLREVRAQIGFTRLEPATPDLQGEFDLEVQLARLSLTQNWLPATEIRGEGVFVQLDEKAVQKWERRPAVVARTEELASGYLAWTKTLKHVPPPFPGARFFMLHSLSHLLISAISLECGYTASAIRERLYCTRAEDRPNPPMAAILLSTGTSGTEGTLGGLVEQGRRLRYHLRHAYDLGRLCSNDPVCASHSPKDDPSERYLEGAACHGCLFIAECSCERFNRYLDRALVVPTVGHDPELAFFKVRP